MINFSTGKESLQEKRQIFQNKYVENLSYFLIYNTKLDEWDEKIYDKFAKIFY